VRPPDVRVLRGPDADTALVPPTLSGGSTADAGLAELKDGANRLPSWRSYTALEDVCQEARGGGSESLSCRKRDLLGRSPTGVTAALLRISDQQGRHDRIAVGHAGQWNVAACEIMEEQFALGPWSQMLDEVRSSSFLDTTTGQVLAIRYVRHAR
jgi:hypothetical protein